MGERLIISDAHIGHPHCDKEALFELISNKWDQVIALGDIFDTYERDYDQDDVDFIMSKCTMVYGNHDLRFGNQPEKRVINFDGLDALCLHGHQYFLWWRFYHPFGQHVHYFFKSKLRYQEWYEGLTKGHVERQLLSIEEKMAIKRCKYPILLMGHTHVPKVIQTPRMTYVNPGDWRTNKTFVVYENKRFKLYQV